MLNIILNTENIISDMKEIVDIDEIISFMIFSINNGNSKIDQMFKEKLKVLLDQSLYLINKYFNQEYLSNLDNIDDLNKQILNINVTNNIYKKIIGEYFDINNNTNFFNQIFFMCINKIVIIYINIIKKNVTVIEYEHDIESRFYNEEE